VSPTLVAIQRLDRFLLRGCPSQVHCRNAPGAWILLFDGAAALCAQVRRAMKKPLG
jgi:hypothetical protein